MTRNQLVEQIRKKRSYLCVGLDTDIDKIPKHLQSSSAAVLDFNKAIIDATRDHCVAYKINTAFYEAMGMKGWEAMARTAEYIGADHFKIADAKAISLKRIFDLSYAFAIFQLVLRRQ